MKTLIITNRKVNNSNATDETLFGEQVNDKGASELRLAWAEKGPGGKWVLELIGEPNQLAEDNMPSREAFNEYVTALQANGKDCVFYIHGFNKSFEESLEQTHALKKRYDVGVVTFSWPANPGGFITKEYKRAKSIASNSIIALDRTFEKFGEYMRCDADESCEVSVNLLVHSLGNYMFERFIRDPIFAGETRIFDNIVLNAADVDVDVHTQWANSLKYSRSVYALINERDRILNISDVINSDRLGNTARGLRSSRITYFDLTDGEKVKKKHQHFGSTAEANAHVKTFFTRVLHGENGFPLDGVDYNPRKNAFDFS